MARKRAFQLTEAEQKELKQVYMATDDAKLRMRVQAVRLYGSGYGTSEVMDITGCGRRTLTTWCKLYQEKGISGLIDKRVGGNNAKLTAAQRAEVKAKLHAYRPLDLFGKEAVATADGQFWTVPDLQYGLRLWFGVEYKHSLSYRQLFEQCGFSYQ